MFVLGACLLHEGMDHSLSGDTKEATMANGVKKIHERVQDAGGIVKINLGELRDELGYARIGKKILAKMSDHLTDSNLGYFPGGTLSEDSNPEPRQWQEVWVYERDGSAKSAVLDAVADPETHDLVAALNMFSEGTPDFDSMDAE